MLVYLKNVDADANLATINGSQTVPIGWWWERIGEVNGTYVYLALSLMMTFFFYFAVSVIELIAWIIFLTGDMAFARLWFSTVGYWGTIIAYALPWIFAAV